MDPSVKYKYILTPCRTFGLQRSQRRTPGSKGLTQQGGNGSSLKAPFRSPLIANGTTSTPPAEKKSPTTPKPSWSTPLLPKSRVRMGLSKPSPKAHPFTKMQTKGLIKTDVGGSKPSQSNTSGSKIQSSHDKALGLPNRLHGSTLLSAQASSCSSLQSNQCASLNVTGDSKSDQSGDEIPLHPTNKSTEVSEGIEPTMLPPKKAQFIDEFSSFSESDDDERNVGNTAPIECSIGETHKEHDSSSSQDSFHGWDYENDQDSMDCDSKKDVFQKCVTSLKIKLESHQLCGPSESKEFVPIKRCSQTNKLSFVKEKFKSKRRLMSDSEDSNSDADGDFSVRRKLSQEPIGSAAAGSPQKKMKTRTRYNRLASSDSDDSDARYLQKVVEKSNDPRSFLGTEKCIGSQPDSEKENSDVTSLIKDRLKNKRSSPVGKTTKSRGRVLSDTDDDGNNVGLHIEPFKKSHVSGSPSEGGNVEHGTSDARSLTFFNDCADDDRGDGDIQKKSYDTSKPNAMSSAPEREEYRSETKVKPGYDEDIIKLGATDLAQSHSWPEKGDPASNSDLGTSSLSKSVKMAISSDAQEGGKVNSTVTLITNVDGNHARANKPRSKICVLSNSDDDNLSVEKLPQKQPQNEALFSLPKEDSSKLKLVVELCRLSESALRDVADEGFESSSSSIGRASSGYDDIEEFSVHNHSKTYGRAALKKGKNITKKARRLSYTKQSLDKSEALSSLEAAITLQNFSIKPHEDNEIRRRYLECFSENEDLERMKGEMQRWLVGGQQVISKIIEEVRLQRDKDMSVMEVLQEHNIDPNLVGYDPAVEEFVSFDKFLLKNNLT